MYRIAFALFCLLGALASPAPAQEEPASAPTTLLHCGWLLDRPGQPARRDVTVTVREGAIVSVTDGFTDPEDGAEVIDLRDKYVLPGQIGRA
ncbi:MAG: hypothetical protein ACF8R7_03755, partial [Phycisphaerales bacterium JB039]